MEIVEKPFLVKVDLLSPGSTRTPLEMRHNDKNELTLSVLANGNPVNLQDLGVVTTFLLVTRNDSQVISVDGNVNADGTASYILNGNALADYGMVEAVAKFYDDNENCISSATIVFKALIDPATGNIGQQENEKTLIELVLFQAPDIIQRAIDATEAAEAKTLELETVVTENTITWLNDPVQTMAELPSASTNLGVAAVVLEPDAQGRYKTVRSDGTTWQTIEAFTPTQYSAISKQLDDKVSQRELPYIVDVNLSEAIAYNNNLERFTLPTYNEGADGEVVHPSVLYFQKKWNGYHYWMAMTPYQNMNSAYENPSILASNDNKNWVVPVGLPNPLVPKPTVGFNADPFLLMKPGTDTMYMIYKYNGETNGRREILILSSENGSDWTVPQTILSTTVEVLSPAICFDGEKYNMWYIDGVTYALQLRTSDNILSGWSEPVACTVSTIPTGFIIWHMEVIKFHNQYHMLALVSDGAGRSGSLYFAKSTDKTNWQMTNSPILSPSKTAGAWDAPGFYKSAMIPLLTDKGLKYGIYYGSLNKSYIGYTELTFDKTVKTNQKVLDLLSATNLISPWVLGDNFDRANSTTGLGNATSGDAWNVIGGTLGILNKKAYAPVAGNNRAYINIPANFYLRFTVYGASTSSEALVQFRRVDDSNTWRVGITINSIKLQKLLAGVLTSKTLHAVTAGKLFDVEIECIGSKVRSWVNGSLTDIDTSGDFSSATRLALQITTTDATIDNLIVKAL